MQARMVVFKGQQPNCSHVPNQVADPRTPENASAATARHFALAATKTSIHKPLPSVHSQLVANRKQSMHWGGQGAFNRRW